MKLVEGAAIEGLKALQEKTGKNICDKLVALYIDSTPDVFQKMDAALTAGEFENLGREAHSLKSSSGNLGAVAMSERCLAIEEAIVEHGCTDTAKLGEMVEQLQGLFDETCNEIKKIAA